MANKTVVRNAAYTRNSVGIRERHNERKNECYSNADIRFERSPLNVHFCECISSPSGSAWTYTEAFDKLVADGLISTRGLKADAKIVDEMIFDVNSGYFEDNGGYDFAKRFYEEAYRLAVKETGDERYILSAVMHADEVNTGLSDELKKDVYHYHLHVVYVPVVKKEVKWTKRCKDPALVGTVREVINQVSHSKKWPKFKDDNGEWVNSYSLLQDRFYQHMKEKGFQDFERGDYKSTRKHLSDTEYKIKKNTERVEKLDKSIADKNVENTELDGKIEKKKVIFENIRQQTAVVKDITTEYREIDELAKPAKFGKNMEISPQNWEKVSNLAKEGCLSRVKIKDLKEKLKKTERDRDIYKSRWEELKEKTKLFIRAIELFPQKVTEFLTNLIKQPKLQQTQRMERSKSYER